VFSCFSSLFLMGKHKIIGSLCDFMKIYKSWKSFRIRGGWLGDCC